MNADPSKRKRVIGLLGGPGSGKSSVARVFAELGCGVINADDLNHQVLRMSEIRAKVVQVFGVEVLRADGEIDRKILSQKVFCDDGGAKLKVLTDIVHPEIFKLMKEQIGAYGFDSSVRAIVLDVPLLVEVGWERVCDYLIFVEVDDELRRSRLKINRNWDEKLIKSIENSQILLDKKRKISDYIVENNSDIDDLRKQVEKISPEIV